MLPPVELVETVKLPAERHPIRLIARRDDAVRSGPQLLTRTIPAHGRVGSVSRGPAFTAHERELTDAFLIALP